MKVRDPNVVYLRIQDRVSSLLAKNENLTPNGLYVGVLTLASMVFTRHRAFPIRWTVPPVVLVASMRYFLPGTSDNIAEYYEKKEEALSKPFSEARRAQWTRAKQFWYTGIDHLQMTREKLAGTWTSTVRGLEDSTGLQVSSILSGSDATPSATPNSAEPKQTRKLV